jgi:YfiH family protein
MIEAALVERAVDSFPIPWLEVPEWTDRYGVVAGLTGRGPATDPFDLGLASSQPTRLVLNRWRLLQSSFPTFGSVVVARQVHGRSVLWHDQARGWTVFEGADGHATRTPGILLAISIADCVPIYVLDPRNRAVALLHAGWRGTAADILGAALEELAARVGSQPADLAVHIGVGICGDCYQVGAEVAEACGVSARNGGPIQLDLRRVIRNQALSRGVTDVTVSTHCSAHHRDRFMSHRGSGGVDGRMVAVLGLKV